MTVTPMGLDRRNILVRPETLKAPADREGSQSVRAPRRSLAHTGGQGLDAEFHPCLPQLPGRDHRRETEFTR